MGAEVSWKVRVILAVEGWVDVEAVTSDEALEKASSAPGVIDAIEAEVDSETQD